MRIHPETRIGAVHYTVRDLNRQVVNASLKVYHQRAV
jgi:hypothetical protein